MNCNMHQFKVIAFLKDDCISKSAGIEETQKSSTDFLEALYSHDCYSDRLL